MKYFFFLLLFCLSQTVCAQSNNTIGSIHTSPDTLLAKRMKAASWNITDPKKLKLINLEQQKYQTELAKLLNEVNVADSAYLIRRQILTHQRNLRISKFLDPLEFALFVKLTEHPISPIKEEQHKQKQN